MPIYMQFTQANGGVIKGDVTETGHAGWIELSSAQLGVHRHITNATGRGTNREAAAPPTQEIVITKFQDCASDALFKQSLWGEGATVRIDFVRREDPAKPSATYMSLTLENTLITSFSTSGSGGDAHAQPMESLSLNFTKVTYQAVTADRLIPGAKTKP